MRKTLLLLHACIAAWNFSQLTGDMFLCFFFKSFFLSVFHLVYFYCYTFKFTNFLLQYLIFHLSHQVFFNYTIIVLTSRSLIYVLKYSNFLLNFWTNRRVIITILKHLFVLPSLLDLSWLCFFFSLSVIISSFFAHLAIFIWCQRQYILPCECWIVLYSCKYFELCFGTQLSCLERVWSIWILLLSFLGKTRAVLF